MQKTKITNKYMEAIKIVLIAMAFSVVYPIITFAQNGDAGQTYDYPTMGQTYDYPTVSTGQTYDYPTMGQTYDYPTLGQTYDYPTVTTGQTYDYPTMGQTYDYPTVSVGQTYNYPTVSSGSYSGGSYYPSYYYPSYQTVTSGSFSGGNTYITQPTVYHPQTPIVTSGSFSGGDTYTTYPTYYYPQTSTVTSGGYSSWNPTYYSQNIPNQVLSYTDTNPSLDSVYLSDVPYTGLADSLPLILFIFSLTLWSGIMAYVFLKRKISSQEVFANAYINEIKTNDSVTSGFTNQIMTDNSDISKVEEYARINKILLSSDAAAKIIRLSRLGKINAPEYIRSIATGEWKGIGEGDIK